MKAFSLIAPVALVSVCASLTPLPRPAAESGVSVLAAAPLTLRVRVIELKADRGENSPGLAGLREIMLRGPAMLPEDLGINLGQGLRDRFTPAEIEADYFAAQLIAGDNDARTQIGATRVVQTGDRGSVQHRDYGIILDASNEDGQIRFRFEASLPNEDRDLPNSWQQVQVRGELPAETRNRTWLIAAGRYPGRGEVIVLASIGDASGQR